MDLTSYFTDPVLRSPTIGSMLMCLGAALVGVVVFLRKQSLVGESLSHAAYPGVILGVVVAAPFIGNSNEGAEVAVSVMVGAFLSALAGLWCIEFLQRRCKVRADSALCFVLSAFFGIGLMLASRVQFTHTSLYLQIQIYLYGQAATMTDFHILLYGILAGIIFLTILFLYKEVQIITFDRQYAASLGIRSKMIDRAIFFLIALAVVVGIRSVGVVLMSAMLIAPAAAARQYTNKMYAMFFLASFFGVASGFLGNVLSLEISDAYSDTGHGRLALPTGPMIVLVASAICALSLLFAPERGLCPRLVRIAAFRYRCLKENILKVIWRLNPEGEVSIEQIAGYQSLYPIYLRFLIQRLTCEGWVEGKGHGKYSLTTDGRSRAAKIVRLHRLWELYLADCLGMGVERVHRSAEEMEHILTPELEEKLTYLLKDPKKDPHQQPIPPKDEVS